MSDRTSLLIVLYALEPGTIRNLENIVRAAIKTLERQHGLTGVIVRETNQPQKEKK